MLGLGLGLDEVWGIGVRVRVIDRVVRLGLWLGIGSRSGPALGLVLGWEIGEGWDGG